MVLLVVVILAGAVVPTVIGQGKSKYATSTNGMLLGSAVCVWNYLVANQMSDSFGPSTAPFFWIPLALLISYRSMRRSPAPETGERRLTYREAIPRAAPALGT
ncbi:hypothetical protein D9M68_227280 [compost metagenome]